MEISLDKDNRLLIDGGLAHEPHIDTPGGHSRRILFHKDLVIKINTHSVGSSIFDQSTNEITTWQRLLHDDRQHFAEVVDGGIITKALNNEDWSWVAQRFLNLSKPWSSVPDEVGNLIIELTRRYSLRDIDAWYCGRNWAMVDNIPVIYDYGSVASNLWGLH